FCRCEFAKTNWHLCFCRMSSAPHPCMHADLRACVHVPRASMQIGEHAWTYLVQARRSASIRARGPSKHADRRTCVQVTRASMQIGEHACMSFVLSYT